MTKKDYALLADAFLEGFSYDCDTLGQMDAVGYVAQRLADKLEKNYKNFDRIKFLKACGAIRERTLIKSFKLD